MFERIAGNWETRKLNKERKVFGFLVETKKQRKNFIFIILIFWLHASKQTFIMVKQTQKTTNIQKNNSIFIIQKKKTKTKRKGEKMK